MCQSCFPAEELAQRREKLFDAIGDQAVAVLQGSDYPQAMRRFRQYNEFYYFTGIEVAHAYVVMDGRTRRTILYLPRESQISRDHDDAVPSADNVEYTIKLTGVDEVRGIEALGPRLQRPGVVYAPFRQGQGFNMTCGSLGWWHDSVTSDPWDGQLTRSAQFINKLRSRYPGLEFRNLTPIIDDMRLVKSEREIALCRRAGHLTAIGACEALRSTKPGVFEYQLDAVMRYHYVAGGAHDVGYPAIVAGGVNAWHAHYQINHCELKDGDLVLVDCAPDYHYYTSDIGRMWPVNGTYSQAHRELYGFVVEYHKSLLAGIRPGRTYADIHAESAEAMRALCAKSKFSKPIYKAACEKMCEFTWHLSHSVGMCVHDGSLGTKTLEPGMVFSVDPQMRVPEERLYIRCEDTIVVTEDGIENFTEATPLELDDTEKMMTEPGLLQAFAPLAE